MQREQQEQQEQRQRQSDADPGSTQAPGSPLHFCMLTSFYPPHNFGGDGIFVQRLARALVRRGHRVTVVYCEDAYNISGGTTVQQAESQDSGITVHRLKSNAGALSPLVTHQFAVPGLKSTALKKIFSQHNFDVVHFHNISLLGGPGIFDYGTGVKLYTAHEYWLVCPLSTLWKPSGEPCTKQACASCMLRSGKPPQLWRYSALLQRKLAQMDALLAPSAFSISKHAEMGLSLPFQHFPNFLPDAPPSTAESTESVEQRPFFLMVGRLEQSKGFQNAITLFRDYTAADLVVAGTGQFEDALLALADGSTNIRFTGKLTHKELASLYQSATAVIVPSLWYEPFGLVVLEAFAQRTPVIVNQAGALPELIELSDGGFTYNTQAELRIALDRLLASQQLAAKLGANGFAALQKHWSEDTHLSHYLTLIESLQKNKTPL